MEKLYVLIKAEGDDYINYDWEHPYRDYTTGNTQILGYSTNLEDLEYIQLNYDLRIDEELFIWEVNEITREAFIKAQRYIEYSSWTELKRHDGHFVYNDTENNKSREVFSVDKNSYPLDTIVIDVHSPNKNTINIFLEMRSDYNDMEDIFISTTDNFINKLNFLLSNLKSADVRSTKKVVESIKKLK